MARVRIDLPPQDQVRDLLDGEGRLAVRVTPGARVEGISVDDGQLSVKVRAKPQDGAANDAVMALVAQAVGVAPSRVELLRGATSRNKQLRILL